MPIYEYRCRSCGHEFDALQKIADPPLTDCPECSEAALKRLVSAPAFRLKGSGWYETDFKSEKERRRNLAGDGAGTGEAAKDGSGKKSETPAEKAGGGDSKASESKTEAKESKGSSKPGSARAGSEAA